MTVAQVRVEQCDRQLAGDWLGSLDGGGTSTLIAKVWAGQRDNHPLVQAFAKHRLATAAAPGVPEGYSTAFYEIAAMLGIGARPASPETVWRDEMKPALQRLLAAAPTPPTTHQGGAAEMREAVDDDSIYALWQLLTPPGNVWTGNEPDWQVAAWHIANRLCERAALPLPAAEAPQGWRGIESAPKDGTYVLVGGRGETPTVAFWRNGVWDDGDFFDNLTGFTHWMPLPAAPSTLSEGEGT